MNLQEYFSTEPRGSKKEMADYLGISQVWLSQLIKQKKEPSVWLARKILRATQGLVTLHDLRPDLFGPNQEIL